MISKKATTRSYKGLILFILLFGPACLLMFISTRGCEHKFKVLDDMGEIPNYSFKDISGKTYSNQSFHNQIVLFTTLQQSCPDSCSISLWHFDQLIYQHIRKNQKKLKDLKIISFITDDKGIPIQNLKNVETILKDQVEEYNPKIWMLANGNYKKLFDITRNGKNLLKEGGNSVQQLLLLVDKKNHLRMVLKGDSEGMIRRMKEHIALLDKQYDKEKFEKSHPKN